MNLTLLLLERGLNKRVVVLDVVDRESVIIEILDNIPVIDLIEEIVVRFLESGCEGGVATRGKGYDFKRYS